MMERVPAPAIVGLGFCLPNGIRVNSDPVFDPLRRAMPADARAFLGFERRRVLRDGESLADLMVDAARLALDDARMAPGDVELLLGLGSVGSAISPNDLVAVHKSLALPAKCRVIPLGSEFTVFNDAVIIGDAQLRTQAAPCGVLIVCGCDWSRHVSYEEATCIGAADGAAAAVMASTAALDAFRLVDHVCETDTSGLGAMMMAPRRTGLAAVTPPFDPGLYTTPLMSFGQQAYDLFKTFGENAPIRVVVDLIRRNGLVPEDVCLIAHQASSVLTDVWTAGIGPGQFLSTLADYGNMTLASVPVTLAALRDRIAKRHLVLLTLGMQQQTSALLLRADKMPEPGIDFQHPGRSCGVS